MFFFFPFFPVGCFFFFFLGLRQERARDEVLIWFHTVLSEVWYEVVELLLTELLLTETENSGSVGQGGSVAAESGGCSWLWCETETLQDTSTLYY